ncbi:MAG: NAD(P)-dependent glycerol-3-phosphate dehydrogenase [Opitutaceae bacterium]|jgi:glycerol-3-phosphate dehydrogenase (NAD(P)+)|nr:NAD(P)-dependent glycerol-3-phosphate dehydrogenase [Opitutaceae bacterium]
MNIAILGAGAWGTAFSIHLSRLGHAVTLVPRRFEQALALATSRENTDYLPGIPLPPDLQIGHELAPVLLEAELLLLACPSQALRATCARIAGNLADAPRLALVINLSKGLELGTHLRPVEIIATLLPDLAAATLTGPTNAAEVARGLPSAMVLATAHNKTTATTTNAAAHGETAAAGLTVHVSDRHTSAHNEAATNASSAAAHNATTSSAHTATTTSAHNAAAAARTAVAIPTAAVQAALSGPSLRIYTSTDVAGAEFGGCLKNIYAITAGCCDGLRLGDNARAALLTRALAEMLRVGQALGARPETFYGLSGFGDLVATCHGPWSRNRQFGIQIGEGRAVAELLEGRKTVVEGYKTTDAFAELCAERKIDAPILRETHAVLYAGKPPAKALADLMGRELKRES